MNEPIANETVVRRRLADAMGVAAIAFLDTLDASQRALAAWPFPATDERERWFYTPTDHGGLTLSAMAPPQQRLAMRLISSGLSRPAYATVSTIIGLDNVLDELEGWRMSWGRTRGRDPGLYYLRVFGNPAEDRHWSWRFGGHHLSLNHTIIDRQAHSGTPCFLGADPAASALLGGQLLRPLGAAEDSARELVQSFTLDQRLVGVVSEVAPVDLVGANRAHLRPGDTPLPLADVWRGHFDGEFATMVETIQTSMEHTVGLAPHHIEAVRFTAQPKGISVRALTNSQRRMLRNVLDVYLRRVPDDLAELELAKFEGDRIESLSFLWAGGIELGEPHYYRIQGPRLVAEYDNSARNANHVHTVWRDPEGDFAIDVLADHYDADHQ